jgi:hypothetical protein
MEAADHQEDSAEEQGGGSGFNGKFGLHQKLSSIRLQLRRATAGIESSSSTMRISGLV